MCGCLCASIAEDEINFNFDCTDKESANGEVVLLLKITIILLSMVSVLPQSTGKPNKKIY